MSPIDKSQANTEEPKLADKDELTLYSRIEKEIIELVKNPPFGRPMYDFEVENFLKEREYKVEDIRRVLERLKKFGIIILTPNGALDINFGKLFGGSA